MKLTDKLSNENYKKIKEYCDKNNYLMRTWIEIKLLEAIKNDSNKTS